MIKNNTPIESYKCQGLSVIVKREDLCVKKGGPPFSKVRGIYDHLYALKKKGVITIGYTETSISMAGWGLTWIGRCLDMRVVIYNPQYKRPHPVLEYHKKQWIKNGATIRSIPAGMAKVNYYISKKLLKKEFGIDAVLLPLGLPFKESIEGTKNEFLRSIKKDDRVSQIKSFVVCIGSGTIASGLWKGVEKAGLSSNVYGIMTRTGKVSGKMKNINVKSGLSSNGFFKARSKFILYDPGWEYTERSHIIPPFPCNPYYDAKAWEWLIQNIHMIKAPVMFWNIGK